MVLTPQAASGTIRARTARTRLKALTDIDLADTDLGTDRGEDFAITPIIENAAPVGMTAGNRCWREQWQIPGADSIAIAEVIAVRGGSELWYRNMRRLRNVALPLVFRGAHPYLR
jgi:hypothetical protein